MPSVNDIILGAGEVFMYEYAGTTMPLNDAIEIEANNVGYCSSGFTVSYKPTKYEIKNQYGRVVKSFVSEEAVSCKTGILTWRLSNLSLFSTGTITSASGKQTLTIGGGNALKSILVRFVHTKSDGKKLRFTMIGQGGNGFQLDFTNTELTVDAELNAIEQIKGYLCSIEEEI